MYGASDALCFGADARDLDPLGTMETAKGILTLPCTVGILVQSATRVPQIRQSPFPDQPGRRGCMDAMHHVMPAVSHSFLSLHGFIMEISTRSLNWPTLNPAETPS